MPKFPLGIDGSTWRSLQKIFAFLAIVVSLSTPGRAQDSFVEVNAAAAASGAVASASSTAGDQTSQYANDGESEGDNLTRSLDELNPWVRVDFEAVQPIGRVEYWGPDNCCSEQTRDLLITLLDSSDVVVWSYQAVGNAPRPLAINLPSAVNAKAIRVERVLASPASIAVSELRAIQPDGTAILATVVTHPGDLSVVESGTATFGPVAAVVEGGPQERLTFQWQRNGVDIPRATSASYTTPIVGSADNGAKYRCRFLLSGKFTDSTEAMLTVTEDAIPPAVTGISFLGGRGLSARVSFSEWVDAATAETVANYVFAGGVTVQSARLLRTYSDAGGTYGSNVVLSLSGPPMNTDYSVRIDSVKDVAGNEMAAAANLSGNVGFYEINLARGGIASSSSVDFGGVPERAIDGDANGELSAGTLMHSRAEPNPYLQVDLPAPTAIGRIVFWRRTDCCDERNTDVLITVRDEVGAVLWRFQQGIPSPTPNPLAFNLDPVVVGKSIRIERQAEANVVLSVAELEAVAPYVNVTIEPTQVPSNVVALQDTTVTFGPVEAAVTGAPADKLSFQWQVNGVDIPGATRASYTTERLSLADNGKTISVKYLLSGVAVTRSAILRVNQDVVAPLVASHGAIGQNIAIRFNELMSATAGRASNYTFIGGTIGLAELQSDGRTVVLRVTGLGNDYRLNVRAGITDLAGNSIVPVTLSGVGFTNYSMGTIGTNGVGDGYTSGGQVFGIRRSGGIRAANRNGDDIQFVYQQVNGDFDKVIRLQQLDEGSRGGLMARHTLEPVSRLVKLVASDDTVAFRNRIVLDWDGKTPTPYDQQGAISGLNAVLANRDQWLRLKRTGQSFHAFVRDSAHSWALVFSKYSVDMPGQMYVGFFVGNNGELPGQAVFSDYGDYVATGDTQAPTLLSGGTWDKKRVGIKFSEQILGASVIASNFSLSQGTVTKAVVGINGDSVYLDVADLASDSFTVTATGVRDLGGNVMVGSQAVTVTVDGWQADDEGVFVDPKQRPQVGDDPAIIGSSTFLASGDQVEIDYIGGGYNNSFADRNHFVYKPISGDFDWAVECTRYDKTDSLAGWGNGGLTVAAGLYAAVNVDGTPIEPNTDLATRVPRYSAVTYTFGSANGNKRALNTWRDQVGDDQGNSGGPEFTTPDTNGFVGKFGTYTRFINSAGEALSNTRPDQNPWLRLVRVGTKVTGYWSLFGNTWQLIDGEGRDMPNIPNDAIIGWMCTTDHNGGYGKGKPNHYVAANLRNFGPYASLLDVRIHPTGSGFDLLFRGGKLQSAFDPGGPWIDVPGGDRSPIRVSAEGGQQFFRVIGN
ncbi:MAG: Ig-like domain-containing protein [Verrucomicrobiales bacterium]|nr:Ig-like domain-containing protein [Verrucomicrobiales bacterium]